MIVYKRRPKPVVTSKPHLFFKLNPHHAPIQQAILHPNVIIHFCYKCLFTTLRLSDLTFPGPLSLYSE
jgi:hypothetical protein